MQPKESWTFKTTSDDAYLERVLREAGDAQVVKVKVNGRVWVYWQTDSYRARFYDDFVTHNVFGNWFAIDPEKVTEFFAWLAQRRPDFTVEVETYTTDFGRPSKPTAIKAGTFVAVSADGYLYGLT